MKIACILTVFPSVTETFVFSDIRALKDAGHDVRLLHFLDGREDVWQEDARELLPHVMRGGPLFALSMLGDVLHFLVRSPWLLLRTACWILLSARQTPRARLKNLVIFPKCVQFARDCRRWAPDQVHAAWANHAAVAALIVNRLTGTPFSISAHAGQDVFRDPVLLREKVQGARFVAVCNRSTYRRLAELAGETARERLHHLSHGVDLARFPGRRGRTRPTAEEARLLFVGRLQYGKGVRFLIEAADRLQREGRPFHLDILGDGPEAAETRASIRRLGLEQRITLHGAVPQDRVAAFLARADALVLPSEVRHDGGREGLPNAVLEALACEVPVVASRISSVEDAVRDGVSGLLVPQKDVPALAAALGRILDEPELARRLGQEGRRLVEERFDRVKCQREFVALFETVS